MGRCGGDGRRLHAHESVKLAIKRLVLNNNPTPSGCVFPRESVIIEPTYLRQDESRPGDIYAIGKGMHVKDSVMDVVVTSALQRSCLSQTSKSSDHVIRKVENTKFRKDSISMGPIHAIST